LIVVDKLKKCINFKNDNILSVCWFIKNKDFEFGSGHTYLLNKSLKTTFLLKST